MKEDENNFPKDYNGDFQLNTLKQIHEEMKNGIEIIYHQG